MAREKVRINKFAGQVIRIDGKCYSFTGATTQAATHEAPDYGDFADCDECEAFIPETSSSSSGSSESATP
jgi:hypothetical protein